MALESTVPLDDVVALVRPELDRVAAELCFTHRRQPINTHPTHFPPPTQSKGQIHYGRIR